MEGKEKGGKYGERGGALGREDEGIEL